MSFTDDVNLQLKAMVKFVLVIDGRKDRVGMADGGILYQKNSVSLESSFIQGNFRQLSRKRIPALTVGSTLIFSAGICYLAYSNSCGPFCDLSCDPSIQF